MSDHLKKSMMDTANNQHWLDDMMIEDMRAAFAKRGIWGHRAHAFCAAIRLLRNRSRDLLNALRNHDWQHGSDRSDPSVLSVLLAIDNLEALLPEVKK